MDISTPAARQEYPVPTTEDVISGALGNISLLIPQLEFLREKKSLNDEIKAALMPVITDFFEPTGDIKMLPWPYKYKVVRRATVTLTPHTIAEKGDIVMVHGWSGAHALVYNPRLTRGGWIPRTTLDITPKVVGLYQVGPAVFFSCPGIFLPKSESQFHPDGSGLTWKRGEFIMVHAFLSNRGAAFGINLEAGTFGTFTFKTNEILRVDSWLWSM